MDENEKQQATNSSKRSSDVPEPIVEKPDTQDTPNPETDSESTSSGANTDSIVDEIAKAESDKVLQAEDEKLQAEFNKPDQRRMDRIKAKIKEWWADPKKRYSFLAGSAVFIIVLFAIPFTRYGILNAVGVRASAKITVVDESTQQPLKNVKVVIDGTEALTDIDGVANVTRVRLGSRQVDIQKIAYADYSEKITLGFGGNELDAISLDPTGAQYGFSVKDWLSKLPIEKAEAVYGESSAVSNSEGNILITIPPTDEEKVTINLVADGYKEQGVEITTSSLSNTDVGMVVGTPQFFVSNRSGNYDVYKVDADGKNEERLLEGTGSERKDITFSVSPDNKKGVLVATRDGTRNGEGFLLSGLYIVDLESGDIEKKDESERIIMAGWADGSIIYVKIAAGASGTNPERHRLMSYNPETNQEVQLASSNYFTDVLVAQNFIFYAPSSAYKENPEPYLFRIKADGTDKQTIIDREVWRIVQIDYDNIVFDSKQTWYKSGIQAIFANKQDGPPSNRYSILYTDNPNGETAAWVDNRDGKGVLLIHNVTTTEDKDIVHFGGMRHPVRWLSEKHLVFRVSNESETADYIVNVEGGEAAKITNVADVPGVDRWYYYY